VSTGTSVLTIDKSSFILSGASNVSDDRRLIAFVEKYMCADAMHQRNRGAVPSQYQAELYELRHHHFVIVMPSMGEVYMVGTRLSLLPTSFLHQYH
jgi:hypothetical protein